jgi:hypothetical protein
MVGEVVGGGGEGFILDLGRRGTEVGLEGAVRPKGVNGKKREKNDLKNCSRWPKTEYVRTYRSTFDRTRAGAWVCVCVIRSNLCKQVRTHACSTVHV